METFIFKSYPLESWCLFDSQSQICEHKQMTILWHQTTIKRQKKLWKIFLCTSSSRVYIAVVMCDCSCRSNAPMSLGQKKKLTLNACQYHRAALPYISHGSYLLLFKLLSPFFFNSCSLLLFSLPLFLQLSPSLLYLLFILEFCSSLLLQYLLFPSS